MKEALIQYILFLGLMLGGWACQGESPGKEAGSKAKEQTQLPEDWLEVKQVNFQLREAPGYDAKAIQRLKPGDRARSLGEQSAFTTRIELGGEVFDELWLLVQLENRMEGWVYALAFLDAPDVELPLAVRLHTLFGATLVERLDRYKDAFEQANTAEKVALAMAMGRRLQDTLVQVLALRAFENERRENLFWLNEAIPAFVPHWMENGRTYHLFVDYRPYLSLAQASEGLADDAFLELCLMAYPEDSIEYFHPAWVFEADEGEVHSLLGRGIHFRFLKKLDKLLADKNLFGQEIVQFRQLLLNDIVGTSVTYWESREKAIAELEQILQAGFQSLGLEEKEALNAKRLQFNDPEKFGIKFNYGSGLYELE